MLLNKENLERKVQGINATFPFPNNLWPASESITFSGYLHLAAKYPR